MHARPTRIRALRRRVARLVLVLACVSGVRAEEAAPPPRGEISGLVTFAGRPVVGRVEVRRLPEDPSALAVGFPSRGSRIPSHYERWLHDGLSVGEPAVTTTADEDGAYVARGLRAGSYEVRGLAPDGAVGYAVGVLAAEGSRILCDVLVPAGPVVWRGRVTLADGRPFQGSIVVEQHASGRRALPWLAGAWRTTTDADGRFVTRGLAPGGASVSAILPGRWRTWGLPVTLPMAEEFTWTVDEGWVAWRGHVVAAESGEPLPGARVFAAHSDCHPPARAGATSGPEGEFELPFSMSGTQVLVTAPGRATTFLTIAASGPPTEPIPLAAAGRIDGRVTTASGGRPVAGVTVLTRTTSPDGAPRPEPAPATTDSDGRYVLKGVHPGDVRVYVQTKEWVSPELPECEAHGYDALAVRLPSGGTVVADRLVVPADGPPEPREEGRPEVHRIRVRIVDARSRAPVAGAYVVEVGSHATRVLAEAITDPDGVATLGPLEGVIGDPTVGPRVEVAVHASGYVAGHVKRGIEEGISTAIEIGLEPPRDAPDLVAIRGFVVPPEGLLPCRVVLRRTGPHEHAGEVAGEAGGGGKHEEGVRVDVARDGTFEERLPKGTYGLRAWAWWKGREWVAQGSVLAGGSPALLRLAPVSPSGGEAPGATGTLPGWSLEVKDAEGRPVPRADVTWAMLRGDRELASGTGLVVDGHFRREVRRVAPDGFLARVSNARDLADRPLPLGAAQIGPLPLGPTPVVWALPPEQRIEGAVVGPDGAGLPGVLIEVVDAREGWHPVGGRLLSARTDARGRFSLRGLGRGRHHLRLALPARFVRVEAWYAEAGDLAVHIPVHAAVAPRIQVLGPDGLPLAGATIHLDVSEDRWTRTDNLFGPRTDPGSRSGPGRPRMGRDDSRSAGWTRIARTTCSSGRLGAAMISRQSAFPRGDRNPSRSSASRGARASGEGSWTPPGPSSGTWRFTCAGRRADRGCTRPRRVTRVGSRQGRFRMARWTSSRGPGSR